MSDQPKVYSICRQSTHTSIRRGIDVGSAARALQIFLGRGFLKPDRNDSGRAVRLNKPEACGSDLDRIFVLAGSGATLLVDNADDGLVDAKLFAAKSGGSGTRPGHGGQASAHSRELHRIAACTETTWRCTGIFASTLSATWAFLWTSEGRPPPISSG